jgi:glycosyltransferase involved in cell wall biosynthesis
MKQSERSIGRLAMLTNATLPLLGGAQQSCWERACELARLGPEVLLLVPDLSRVADRYPDYRRYLGRVGPNLTSTAYPSKTFIFYADQRQPQIPCGFDRIERILAEFRPDLLLVVEPEGLTAFNSRRVPGVSYACRAAIPVVFENHTSYELFARAYFGWWAQAVLTPYLRNLYRFADAVVCFSQWNTRRIRQLVHRQVLSLAFPAVDLTPFGPTNRRRPRPINTLRVVYIGRLASEKRPELLLRATAQARAAGRRLECRLIGDGPARSGLDKLCRQIGMEPADVFTGVLRGHALAEAFADADVYVNPCSIETFGLSTLEALASGVPVVVPLGGGLHEFVRDGVNGRVLPDMTADTLARLLCEFCDRPETLAPLAERALLTAKPFSLEAVCREELAFLQRIVNQGRQNDGKPYCRRPSGR